MWPYSQLLGRELDPSELARSGTYMTLHVGGPLEADVALAVEIERRHVSVTARWSAAGAIREARAVGLAMSDAETLAAEWADLLAAGREPAVA